MSIGIGSTVWVHGEYRTADDAADSEFLIIGEKPRSWVIGWKPDRYGYSTTESFSVQKKPDAKGEHWTAKLPSRGGTKWRVYLSREELDAQRQQRREWRDQYKWIDKHRYAIQQKVSACNDTAVLRQIAALVGYDEGKAEA